MQRAHARMAASRDDPSGRGSGLLALVAKLRRAKEKNPSAWREVTEKLRRVVVDHQVRPAAPDSMAPPAAIPAPTPAATCMDTPLCFEDGRIQTASTERVCDFLRFAKQPKNFHLLLRPCATGLIVANSSLGAHQSWQASKVLLVFPSWIQNFGESVMRTASRLSKGWDTIVVVDWYRKYSFLLAPFASHTAILKPQRPGSTSLVSARGCYRSVRVCDMAALPAVRDVNLHRTMREVLAPFGHPVSLDLSPPTKLRVSIVRRASSRRHLHIRNLIDCSTLYECNEYRFTNLSLAASVLATTDIFISIHGADMANAYAIKPGGRVVEIMPVEGYWECDCTIHRKYFTEATHVSVWSTNRVKGKFVKGEKGSSYHQNLVIDWADIAGAITSEKSTFEARSLQVARHATAAK